MAEGLSERLAELDQAVRRAAELIARLKAERQQAEKEKAAIENQMAAKAREIEECRERLVKLEEGQGELSRLRQERKETLAQVSGILKELNALELG